MKKWKLLLVGLLAFILVGCGNKQTAKETKAVEYTALSQKDQNKIKFELTAKAEIPKDTKTQKVDTKATFSLRIKNNSGKKVKFNLAKLKINDDDVRPTETETITLKKNNTKNLKAIFENISWNESNTIYYGKKKLTTVSKLDNKAELDSWIKENVNDTTKQEAKPESKPENKAQTNTNTTEVSDQELQKWIATSYAKLSQGQFTAEDYIVMPIKSEDGNKAFSINENHSSPNMIKAGADPNTSPAVANVYINAQGQLINTFDNTVLSEKYPG